MNKKSLKKKGFTLIELLAVIVVLAILAVIATPIIMDIIEDSRESAALRSGEFYLDAVELALVNSVVKHEPVENGTYQIMSNGNVCLGTITNEVCSKELQVTVNGNKPTDGTITIKDNEMQSIYFTIDEKEVGKYKGTDLAIPTMEPGEIVYFDVEKGEVCNNYHVDNSRSNYDGFTNYLKNSNGVKEDQKRTTNQNGCMKFYVTKDFGGYVSLILDHNTTQAMEWTTADISTTTNGPINLLTTLYNDTKDWQGTLEPSNEVIDLSGYNKVNKSKFTIDYTGYKARIITANEIAEIIEHPNWNLASGTITLNAPTDGVQRYGWIYDRTFSGCSTVTIDGVSYPGCWNEPVSLDGAGWGYWTVSPAADNTGVAYRVANSGHITTGTINNKSMSGVRPVIAVAKSTLD